VTYKTKQPQPGWRRLATIQVSDFACIGNKKFILVFRSDEVGTVFRPDLYIEDFYFRESAKPHPGLTKLVVGLSAPGTVSATNRSVEHFYARAAKNLKRALSDLQILVLRGGYRYFPLKAVDLLKIVVLGANIEDAISTCEIKI
jgi:hypothetical protein